MQNNKINKGFFVDFFVCILLTFFIYTLSRRYLVAGIGDDEHGVISNGYFIYKGLLPYRDFFVNKPIIFNFISYLSFIILGVNNCAYKLFPFLLIYPSAILFYLTLIKLNIQKVLAASISMYFYFLILLPDFHNQGNFDSETLGIVFIVYAFCSFYLFRNSFGSFLSGVFIAISINSKEPFLLFLIPLSIFLFMEESPLKINKNKFLSLVGGFALINVLFLSYLVLTGSLDAYIDKNDWCFNYAVRAKELGFVTLPDSFFGMLLFDLKNILEKYNNFLFFAPFLVIYAFSLTVKKNLSYGFVLCILSILCGLYAISLGHRFYEHYFIIGIFPFVAFAIYCSRGLLPNKFFYGSFLLLLIANLLPVFIFEITASYKTHKLEADFPVFMKQILPIIKKYTNEKDKIVIAGHPSLYYLANRVPSSIHTVLEQHIFLVDSKRTPSAKRVSMFIDEIEKYKPKIIYFQSEYMSTIHRMTFIQRILFPFIKKNNYFDCGNGLFIKQVPSKEDREKYCIPTLDSARLDFPESIVPFSLEASSEKSSEFKIRNANDNDLTTSWLEGNDNFSTLTIYPKRKMKIKSIWFLPYRIFDIYQGWERFKAKFYLSEKLVSEQEIYLPGIYRVGVQEGKLTPVIADKIELYLTKKNVNRKNVFGETIYYPFNCGYTEILLVEAVR